MRAWWALAPLFVLGCSTAPADGDDDTDTVDTDDTDDTTDTVETDETNETDETDETDGPTDPCRTSPAVLTIGTGEAWDEFTKLTAGQDLEMVNGPQGGWHLTVAVELEHVGEFAIIEVRIVDVESGTVVTSDDPFRFNALLTPVAGPGQPWTCEGRHVNMTAVLDFGNVGAVENEEDPWLRLCGNDVRIEVRVLDPQLTVLGSGSVEVVAQPDPANGPHCVDA